jgi:hypothetical protein
MFKSLYAQLGTVTIVFVATLINPVYGVLAFVLYSSLWAANFYNNFR